MSKEKVHRKRILSPRTIKFIAFAIAVIIQLAVLLVPYLFFRDYLKHINWIFEIVSFIIVLYIVKSDINPVYKIPWIVIIFVFPIFGGVLYLIYGVRHFGKKEVAKAMKMSKDYKQAIRSRQYYNDELRMIDEQISVQTDYLFNKVDAPVYRNTCAEFFPLGEDMLPVMLDQLRKAEKFIFMEYFIIERGEMLDSIVEILEEKAAKGLDVRFMYDSFGSILKAPGDFVRQMRAKGIKCYEFNTFRSILDSRYNNRDHRKICVIDGNVGFTGGVNLADEYINRKVVYGHWKDTAIMIKGEAVWSLTTMFVTLWDSSFNQTDNLYDYIPTKEFNYNDGYFAPYTDYPFDDEPAGKTVYYNMINRANDYIYIMTPYLILDNVMITALANAAKNGIDVRIITPGVPDKKIAYMLTQSYYEILIKAGVKIYEYTPGFVHAKIFVSDDETAVVGTINLDYRSLTHHFENAIWMYKSGAVKAVLDDYRDTLDKCRVVTLETARKKSFIKRLLMPVLRLFSPMF